MATQKEQKKIQPKQSAETVFDINAKAARYTELNCKLEKDMKKLLPIQNEISDLKKEIVNFANDTLGDNEPLEVRTPDGPLKIGTRGTAREIVDMEKALNMIIDAIGQDGALKLLKFSLGDLDKYLPEEKPKQ